MIKWIVLGVLAVLVLIVVGIVVVASFRPTETRIERSVTTTASAPALYAFMRDLRNFEQWNPWEQYDANMRKEVGGVPGEPGSYQTWSGNSQVGSGKTLLVRLEPDRAIHLKVEMYKPMAAVNDAEWRIEDEGAHRKVTWRMEGNSNALLPRIMGLFMDMEGMVGGAFQQGLDKLKYIMETPQA